ncbi:MAG TPA: PmoA family protein, partial [Saprospiraceae bacterium]|nr:PmoA family protein [Saprospiraceae bacterium]
MKISIDDVLTITDGNKPFLTYQFKTKLPPEGINPIYQRSGFVHPLYTPKGQVLTRIQPPDHYHHYGLWNPWTHTLFEQDTVDFWNLFDKEGTVKFSKFTSKKEHKDYASFTALHHHIVFKKDGSEKTALNEWLTYKVYKPKDNQDYYTIDVESKLQCASKSPLKILAYRYAGFGWRATEYWDKYNSEMLTSEGKTRDNTDNTKAKWIIVYGDLPDNDKGGMAMLSHPKNYNHPEPLRIWDKNANGGRGDVFANFAPTKDKDWLLEPKKTYILRYRLLVFNGSLNSETVNTEWQKFAKV